jgi:hypothetical protein
MRQKAEIWLTYSGGSTQVKGKIQNPKKFAQWGPKCGMENAAFFNKLAPIGKMRNTIYKEALKLLRRPM